LAAGCRAVWPAKGLSGLYASSAREGAAVAWGTDRGGSGYRWRMAMAAGTREFPSASLTSPSSLSLSVTLCTRSTGAFEAGAGADAGAGAGANCGGYCGGNAVGVGGACGVGGSEGGGKLRPGSGGGIMPAGMLFCISCNHSGGICGGQLKACNWLALRRRMQTHTMTAHSPAEEN
jgi:hypothetical protein